MSPKGLSCSNPSLFSGYDLGYDYCVDLLLFGSRLWGDCRSLVLDYRRFVGDSVRDHPGRLCDCHRRGVVHDCLRHLVLVFARGHRWYDDVQSARRDNLSLIHI